MAAWGLQSPSRYPNRIPVPVKRVGVMDMFGESARDDEIPLLLEKHGITPFNMARQATLLRERL